MGEESQFFAAVRVGEKECGRPGKKASVSFSCDCEL